MRERSRKGRSVGIVGFVYEPGVRFKHEDSILSTIYWHQRTLADSHAKIESSSNLFGFEIERPCHDKFLSFVTFHGLSYRRNDRDRSN